jgi:two-component sensor histidine kinase
VVGVDETVIRIPLDYNGHGPRNLPTGLTLAALTRREAADPVRIADGCHQAAAAAGIVLASQDLDLRYRWACGADLFDQPMDTLAGRVDRELLAPEAANALTRIKLQVLADGEPRHTVLHLESTVPERWFSIHVRPRQDQSGRINGVVSACQEITLHKAEEKRMALLMREMEHRSRNILAVTEAMARQSMAYSKSLDDFSGRFSIRLHSLAMSLDLLTRRDWAGAHLHDLIRSQLGHYLEGDPPQISIDGPDVFLAATAIPYLGLALHELSTNAAKHGALSVAQGRVTIGWGPHRDAEGKEHIWLNWTEIDGPPVAPPARQGFGTDVIKRIVSRALRGEVTLTFAPDGVLWRLDVLKANLDGDKADRQS